MTPISHQPAPGAHLRLHPAPGSEPAGGRLRETLTIRFGRPVEASAAPVAPERTGVRGVGAAPRGPEPLGATDPRWVLAVRTMQVSPTGVLPPADRRRLLEVARMLGVGLFQANLVIAIAQDQARRGLPLTDAATTLSMIDGGSAGVAERKFRVAMWCVAIVTIEVIAILLSLV